MLKRLATESRRRWYLTVPTVLLALVIGVMTYQLAPQTYTKQSTLLLIPAKSSFPESNNQFIYVGTLSQASDALISAMAAERSATYFPTGSSGEVTFRRDPSSSGPLVQITAVASTSEDATIAVREGGRALVSELFTLQREAGVADNAQITSITLGNVFDGQTNNRLAVVLGLSAALGALLLGGFSLLLTSMSRAKADDISAGEETQNESDPTLTLSPPKGDSTSSHTGV